MKRLRIFTGRLAAWPALLLLAVPACSDDDDDEVIDVDDDDDDDDDTSDDDDDTVPSDDDDDDDDTSDDDDDVTDDDDDDDDPLACAALRRHLTAAGGIPESSFLFALMQIIEPIGAQFTLYDSRTMPPATSVGGPAPTIFGSSIFPQIPPQSRSRLSQQALSEPVVLGDRFLVYLDYTIEEGEAGAILIQEEGIDQVAVITGFGITPFPGGGSSAFFDALIPASETELVGTHTLRMALMASDGVGGFDPCRTGTAIDVEFHLDPAP